MWKHYTYTHRQNNLQTHFDVDRLIYSQTKLVLFGLCNAIPLIAAVKITRANIFNIVNSESAAAEVSPHLPEHRKKKIYNLFDNK